MKEDKLLKKHCYIECKYGNMFTSIGFINEGIKQIVNEGGGIMNGIDDYLSAIEGTVKRDIADKDTGDYTFTYDRSIFPFETFFDSCEIIVNTHINQGEKDDNSGGYQSGLSGWKSNDDYFVKIIVNAWGTKERIPDNVRVSFAHEITHAYDDYGRRRLSKKKIDDLYTSSIKGGLYNATNKRNITDKLFGSIYNLIYFTSNIEINGYIGQIKEELRIHFKNNPPASSKDIFEAIKNTQAYRTINNYEDEVKSLNYIVNQNDADWNSLKERIVATYKAINKHDTFEKVIYGVKDRSANTAKQVAKIVTKKYEKLKARFYSRAPRIAYEVYMEQFINKPPKKDEGPTMNEELKKIKDLMKKI